MNGPHPSELLSAYLDDEVTAEQRARVDDWLASSSDGRRELEDLRSLSRLLTETLPLLEAPVGLADRIRESIGDDSRESVRVEDPRTAPSALDRTPSETRSPQRRSLGVSAALSLCATLVVVVTTAFLLGPPPQDVREHAGRESEEGTIVSRAGEVRDEPIEERKPSDPVTMAAAARPDPVEPFAAGLATNDTKRELSRGADARAVEQPRTRPRRYYVDGRGLARGDGLVMPTTTPDELAAGDVLPVVETRGGRVSVVEVTVVDVRRALGEVQLLLKQNAIQELPAEVAEDAGENADDRGVQRDDEFAVYVSTSPERLLAALAAIRSSELVVSVDGLDSQASARELAKSIKLSGRAKPSPIGGELAGIDEDSAEGPVPSVGNLESKPTSRGDMARPLTDSYQLLGAVRRAPRVARTPGVEKSATRHERGAGAAVDLVEGEVKDRAPAQPTRVLLLLRPRDRSGTR